MSYTVGWPDAEYHEIIPNLYLGGHLWEEHGVAVDARHSTVSEDDWDYVVSMYLDWRKQARQALPRCDMRFVLFDDTEDGLSNDTWERIRLVVDEVTMRWHSKQKILIRCQAGYNRSSLVMALVLMSLGFDAERAISLMRARRGPDVLINPVFEQYVLTHENRYRRPEQLTDTVYLMNSLSPAKVE